MGLVDEGHRQRPVVRLERAAVLPAEEVEHPSRRSSSLAGPLGGAGSAQLILEALARGRCRACGRSAEVRGMRRGCGAGRPLLCCACRKLTKPSLCRVGLGARCGVPLRGALVCGGKVAGWPLRLLLACVRGQPACPT
jgi:hypothetical protein